MPSHTTNLDFLRRRNKIRRFLMGTYSKLSLMTNEEIGRLLRIIASELDMRQD